MEVTGQDNQVYSGPATSKTRFELYKRGRTLSPPSSQNSAGKNIVVMKRRRVVLNVKACSDVLVMTRNNVCAVSRYSFINSGKNVSLKPDGERYGIVIMMTKCLFLALMLIPGAFLQSKQHTTLFYHFPLDIET